MDNSHFVKGVKAASLELVDISKKRVEASVKLVEARATELSPVNFGILKASNVSDVRLTGDEVVGLVGNTAQYAPFVHQGTGIYAVGGNGRKSSWKFFIPDRYGTKRWYVTKGQKPQPFLQRAISEKLPEIKKLLGGK
ncbi:MULTISPECIES: hypothetical protein [unclassified Gemella]|uniref:hypothetical protein n=1 Tax=unclassified Gemella TaxID=2624949 RepID=UPI001C051F0E|nr:MULTISPECIES: hypothetical protein [unclassified Gemella]MBU0279209.1 hypothetical protein [Gemella sp. zg-1178]QWQ39314.1 hypothetical protein KMP11_03025 [Gemella sp. zg-570]